MPASLNQGQSPRFGACPCLSPREKTSRQHSQPETRAQDPKEENLEDQPTLVDEKSGAKPKIRLEGKNEQATFMAKDLVPNPEPVTTNFFVELEGVEEIIETEEAEEEGDAFQNDYIVSSINFFTLMIMTIMIMMKITIFMMRIMNNNQR
ncbi:uncharacterized protein LOC122267118 [Penaeus japonicus]|uniref:uncharacterized protein LOC122267118 n=1 Tax=Penaeus japonicus TaxID=27405 RepID=UPI001C70F8E9|nr:uncharacterized protein LOC122267118 [Penaeus japonicus]